MFSRNEDQKEQRDTVNRLISSFPSLSVSDARQLLVRSGWNLSAATQLAQEEEAKKLKRDGKTNYYAGDGQVTLGREPQEKDPKALLDELFKKAQEPPAAGEDGDGSRAFFGEGRRLGHTANPSPPVASTLRAHRDSVLEVYSNGFVLENGDFIEMDSAEGREGMKEMNQGFVPSFLRRLFPNADLSVTLHDKSGVSYTPPAHVPFRGEGRRLCASSGAAVPPTAVQAKPFVFREEEPSSFILLVSSKGERKEFKVNPERHTVGDVYGLAHALEPDLPAFTLLVRELPPRKLDVAQQRDETLAQAKLTRAVIAIQK